MTRYGDDIRARAFARVPRVVEHTHAGERGWDIFSRLLKDRVVFLGTAIDDDVANVLVAQLLFLDAEDPKKDITIYINSPGGVVTAGLAIYDTIQLLHCDVSTYCLGQASSMASFLLATGTKGKRFALPNARIMLHQPLGGFQGQTTDIEIQAREALHARDTMNALYAKHTGQSIDTIKKDTDRDNFMSPDAAVKYGLIDGVLTRTKR